MKLTKKILCFVLVALMAAGLLSACESTQEKMEKLSGTWVMTFADTEEQALALLENIDLYEEEIALVDLTSLQQVTLVEFQLTGDYNYAYHVEGTRACVRRFYEGVFDALYEGRATLNETYGVTFDDMSREDFNLFYAELYSYTDFDALLDYFTEIAYDYETLGEPWEVGTYTIRGSQILCTIDGETQAESMGYVIDGDTLTLTYADGEEVYTKGN